MKDITPRPLRHPRPLARVLFFLLGVLFAAWELRALWRELTGSLRRLRRRN